MLDTINFICLSKYSHFESFKLKKKKASSRNINKKVKWKTQHVQPRQLYVCTVFVGMNNFVSNKSYFSLHFKINKYFNL